MKYKIKERYYQASKKIIKRNLKDFTRAAGLEKAIREPFLPEHTNAMLPDPSLVSSSHGKIKEVLLTIPEYAVSGGNHNPYWLVFSDLIKKLPSYTIFIIVIHDSVKAVFEKWLISEQFDVSRFKITGLPDHLYFSVWAEDGYAISKSGSKTFFVEPLSFPRYADSMIANTVHNFTGYELSVAPLYFQGGNILIGDDFFLIGAD